MVKANWENMFCDTIPGWHRWVDAAKEATFFGVPVKELQREGLLAVIGQMQDALIRQQEVHSRELRFINDLREAMKNK